MTRARDISNVITDADLSGNIDVDGTANLDVVDIDGAVDMASTLAVSGHGSVGGNNVASNRALTVVGDTDGTSSSIIVGYNSSLAQKFSVRDDGFTTIANGIDVADGNITFADGHGIDFGNASGSASGSASALLDDYEEGTWTPTLTSSSGASRSVDSQVSRYTKIGRICYVSCQIGTIGALSGSNTGTLRVDGLPFNYNGSVSKSITSDVRFQHVNLPSGIIQTTMIQNSSGTTNEFFFSSTFDDNSAGELGISALSTSSDITFSLVYEVA